MILYANHISDIDTNKIDVGADIHTGTDGQYQVHRVESIDGPFIKCVTSKVHFLDSSGMWEHTQEKSQYLCINNSLLKLPTPQSVFDVSSYWCMKKERDARKMLRISNAVKTLKRIPRNMCYLSGGGHKTSHASLTIAFSDECYIHILCSHNIFVEHLRWETSIEICLQHAEALYELNNEATMDILNHLLKVDKKKQRLNHDDINKFIDYVKATKYDMPQYLEDPNKEINLALVSSIITEGNTSYKDELRRNIYKMYSPIYQNTETDIVVYINTVRARNEMTHLNPIIFQRGEEVSQYDRNDIDHAIARALVGINQMNSSTSRAVHPIHGISYDRGYEDKKEIIRHIPEVGTIWLTRYNDPRIYVYVRGHYILAENATLWDLEKYNILLKESQLLQQLTT